MRGSTPNKIGDPRVVDDLGSGPPPVLHMNALTRPSKQLRFKSGVAILRGLHQTIRLILLSLAKRERIYYARQALHKRPKIEAKEGTNLLKYVFSQLNNGKLALYYKHARRMRVHYTTFQTSRLVHQYSMGMHGTLRAHYQPPHRGMSFGPCGHQQNRQRRRGTTHYLELHHSGGRYGYTASNHEGDREVPHVYPPPPDRPVTNTGDRHIPGDWITPQPSIEKTRHKRHIYMSLRIQCTLVALIHGHKGAKRSLESTKAHKGPPTVILSVYRPPTASPCTYS
jgi:hypothetical protein